MKATQILGVTLFMLAGCVTGAGELGGASSEAGLFTEKQKDGFVSLTGAEFPEAFVSLADYCRRALPAATAPRRTVPGYADLKHRCVLEKCVDSYYRFVVEKGYVEFYGYPDLSYSRSRSSDRVYRLSLHDKEAPECARSAELLAKVLKGRRLRDIPEDKCLSLEQQDSVEAPVVLRDLPRQDFKSGEFQYSISGEEVVDRETGEALANEAVISMFALSDVTVQFTCSSKSRDLISRAVDFEAR